MNRKILIFGILVLAFILRFWNLGSFPAFNADEAALGYNAYSLLETGKDEHGNAWPIHFQSFNDYKPGLYVYLAMPFIAAMGLNEWAVRIPGALAGVGTVWIVYLLVGQLSLRKSNSVIARNEMTKQSPVVGDLHAVARDDKLLSYLPLTTCLLLAISPWHIHFSRGAWEVNVATFFITTGLFFFIKSLKKSKLLVFCLLFFVLSLYTYHAARIIVPLLGIGLLFIYRKELLWIKKSVAISGVIGVILLAPLMFDLLGPAGISRAAGVGLFADTGPVTRINEQRGEHGNYNSLVPKLLHNKAVNYGLAFLDNWATHYQGEFLFMTGDVIQRNRVPDTGQMYLFEIVTVILGLWAIVKYKSRFGIILWWLLIAPIASALTFQSPHALRAQNMIIPLVFISAYGLCTFLVWSKNFFTKTAFRTSFYVLLSVICIWNFAHYEHEYWVHMAKEQPYSSQYGVKELVEYVNDNKDKYESIIITTRYDQPYILFLFFSAAAGDMKYPPARFQKEHTLTQRDQFGFSTVNHFDKYYFQPIDFDHLKTQMPKSLIAGTPEEIHKEANIVKRVYGTNGFEYFDVVAN